MDKIIIFGAGIDGYEIYNRLCHKYSILYVVDKYINADSRFDPIMISPINRLKSRNPDEMVVISSVFHCRDMAVHLETNYGLRYGVDYIYPWDVMSTDSIYWKYIKEFSGGLDIINKAMKGRKLAVIHGNCQTDVYKRNLILGRKFREEYFLLSTSDVVGNGEDIECIKFLIESGIIERIDLFISQVIADENRFDNILATNYIISKLNKNCRVVKIPNFYFAGYLPQIYNDSHQKHPLTLGNGDINIDSFILSGMSDAEIFSRVENVDFYSEDIIEKCENELSGFFVRERKQQCDINCDEFILNNYRKEILFFEKNHISDSLSEAAINELLSFIGVGDEHKLINENNNYCRFGVYPSVIKILGLPQRYNNISYLFGEKIPAKRKQNFHDITQMYIDIMRGIIKNSEFWREDIIN